MSVVVSAFYKFVRIEDPPALRVQLAAVLESNSIRGTILVAPEGINGTISGPAPGMAAVLSWLRSDTRFADLATKDAVAGEHPFKRLKVKLKREIVSMRAPEADPTVRVGVYVEPKDWNDLIADPDVLVVDSRNVYEVAEGTFEGAVDPQLDNFTQWPDYVKRAFDPAKHKKVAMFCTGGIRCEKASAYMLAHGFGEVYHLKGGILNYLAKVPAEESRWLGKCFVFDERSSVDEETAGSGET